MPAYGQPGHDPYANDRNDLSARASTTHGAHCACRQFIGQPADIADAAVFLASERAGYITGEEIVVDGGFTRTIMGVIPRLV